MNGKSAASASWKWVRATTALILFAGLSSSANAGLIDFSPTGGATVGGFSPGTIQNVVSFNLGAGDALAKASITPGVGLTVGSTFQLYYQTVVNSLNTTSGVVNPDGLNSKYQITEVSTFNETVTSLNANGTALFKLTPGRPNLTSIYYENLTLPGAIKANAATGAGFSMGTLIMNLTTQSDTSNYTDTTANGSTPGRPALNQAGYGNFAGTTTDQGTGSASLGLGVNGYLGNFFNTPGITNSLFSSNLKNPFTEIPPSTAFNNPFAPGAPTVGVIVGANNGTSGPDFLLQISGASQSFTVVVPEPASVAMTLMGLGAVALFARRRVVG